MISVAAGVTIGLFVSQVMGMLIHLRSWCFVTNFGFSISVWFSQECCTFRVLRVVLPFVFPFMSSRVNVIM